MTDREALQQALEALKFLSCGDEDDEELIKALRERLARPEQEYPDNFIDALKYDVAKRDSEAQQAYEDAFVNGTGVLLGGKRIDPASIYKEPEQEPVAWMWMLDGEVWDLCSTKDRFTPIREGHIQVPLYTSPPASKPWVGLTDDDIDAALLPFDRDSSFDDIARAIEAKLREKNHG